MLSLIPLAPTAFVKKKKVFLTLKSGSDITFVKLLGEVLRTRKVLHWKNVLANVA